MLAKNELNTLDRQVTKAKHITKSQCCKVRCGMVQWCLSVMAAINKILFWKSILKHELGGKVGLLILFTWAKKAGVNYVPFPDEYPRDLIQEQISKAYKHFKFLKQDDNHRDMWISQLIVAQADTWNWTRKALWTQLCSTKRIHCMANNVHHALNKLVTHRLLTMVIVPGLADNTCKEFHQKVELEQACLAEAGRCFTQAQDMPLLLTPLLEIFGKCRKSKGIAQVLAGEFNPPPLAINTQQNFCQHCHDPRQSLTLPLKHSPLIVKARKKAWNLQAHLHPVFTLGIISLELLIRKYWLWMQPLQIFPYKQVSHTSNGKQGQTLWLRRLWVILMLKTQNYPTFWSQL